MAAKKETLNVLERTYNVPLRKEYMKAPRWNRTKKATIALRQFLARHMKSEKVKLSQTLNEFVWKDGIKNPPHHVKVNVTKNDQGEVYAHLFGEKTESSEKKKPVKKEEPQTKKAD